MPRRTRRNNPRRGPFQTPMPQMPPRYVRSRSPPRYVRSRSPPRRYSSPHSYVSPPYSLTPPTPPELRETRKRASIRLRRGE